MKLTCRIALGSAHHCQVNNCYMQSCRAELLTVHPTARCLFIRQPVNKHLLLAIFTRSPCIISLVHPAAGSIASPFQYDQQLHNSDSTLKSTLSQRHDVLLTLNKCWFNVLCQEGGLLLPSYDFPSQNLLFILQ